MRPIYETEADRVAERQIITKMMPHWRFEDALKLPIGYGVDFALIRDDDIMGFAEIKARNLVFGFGDGYYLALQKVIRAREITTASGIGCRLVVRFSDGKVRWCNIGDYTPSRIIPHGRRQQRDRYDTEPCVVYPWSKFREVQP
jgi:hypothetical protein